MAGIPSIAQRHIISDEWLHWDPETIAWYPEDIEPPQSEPLPSTGSSRGSGRWLAVEAFLFVLGGFLTGVVSALALAAVVLLLP